MKKILQFGLLALLLGMMLLAGCAKKSVLGPDLTGDTVAPTVSSTLPANGVSGVAINASVTATFSEAMNATTITAATFTLKQGTNSVAGAVSYTGTVATFKSTTNLAGNTLYTATVTTGAQDLAGNALAVTKVWTFTTGASPDTTPPTVNSTVPLDTAGSVAVGANITATFSEAMSSGTITSSTFTLVQGVTPVAGAVSYAAGVATFNPTVDLAAGTPYTATITTGAQDLAGNPIALAYSWTFTTASGPMGPAMVNLGSAINFVILSKSGIDSATASSVIGNIGVCPILAIGITGFSLVGDGSAGYTTSSQVAGNVYAPDYAVPTPTYVDTARLDMEAAYVDANTRNQAPIMNTGAGEIGGMTLAPGLYQWGTALSISSDVTLSGGANDVWIFQVLGTSGLSMAAGTKVILAGNAKAKNIFWQVSESVTLNAGSLLEGIVLAGTAINLVTGASVNGRLYSQTAVNISGSTVTQPAP